MIKRTTKFVRDATGTMILSPSGCEDRQEIHALRPVRRTPMSRVKSGKLSPTPVTARSSRQPPRLLRRPLANFRTATQAVDKANQYATRDRKVRKRSSARCGSSGSTPPCGCSTPR
jgi:hypothetical protein